MGGYLKRFQMNKFIIPIILSIYVAYYRTTIQNYLKKINFPKIIASVTISKYFNQLKKSPTTIISVYYY